MYQTIKGQKPVTNQLSAAIQQGKLPAALIIQGDRFTGRLSTALETARILSCCEAGAADCTCSNCRNLRNGSNPYTLMMLSRNLSGEIGGAARSLLAESSEGVLGDAGRDRFFLQVRKLTSRFQEHFFQDASASQKVLLKQAFAIDDQLMELEELFRKYDKRKIKKTVNDIIGACAKLSGGVKTSNIPVSHLRRIASWIYSYPESEVKTIIIEGIERFSDASKNALLKILEEPPKNSYFILISGTAAAVPSTILSRTRKLLFHERGWEDDGEIIKEFYGEDPENYDSLKTFFMTASGIDCRSLRQDVEQFLSAVTASGEPAYPRIQKILKRVDSEKLFREFLEEMASAVELELHDRILSHQKAAAIYQEMKLAAMRHDEFNQQTTLALESLYHRIRVSHI